jgi:hypothetical protein
MYLLSYVCEMEKVCTRGNIINDGNGLKYYYRGFYVAVVTQVKLPRLLKLHKIPRLHKLHGLPKFTEVTKFNRCYPSYRSCQVRGYPSYRGCQSYLDIADPSFSLTFYFFHMTGSVRQDIQNKTY